MKSIEGFIYIILAGIGFGFLGIFGKLAFQNGISVGLLLTARFTLASLIMWLSILFYKKNLIFISRRQIFISVLLGLFGYAIFSTLYFKSIQGLSVSLAAMLLFTFPVFVNLGSYLIFKEKQNVQQIIGLILTMIGVTVLLWSPVVIESKESIIWALLAALTYSAYVIASGYFQQKVNPLSSTLYVISAAAVGLWLFHQPSIKEIQAIQLSGIGLIIGLSTICTILPITLFLKGLQKLRSSEASVIVTVEPIVATLAGWFILNESLTWKQILGAVLILVSFLFFRKNANGK